MSAIASAELQAVSQADRQTLIARAGLREFLTFRVGAEEYGIDILRVQEIRSYEVPTRLAGAPSTIGGVTHLRGTIVPILDLRLQLGAESAPVDGSTVTIVLNVHGSVVGTVVDSVSDVVALEADQIKPAPTLRNRVGSDHIVGIAPIDSPQGTRMMIILDIASLMSSPDVGLAMAA